MNSLAAKVRGLAMLVVFLGALEAGAQELGKEYDPPQNYPEVVNQLETPSDVFAAFLVAHEADCERFEERKGVDLTPQEFARRHSRVFITRLDNGIFDIQMGPEAIEGGDGRPVRLVKPGRRYLVDGRSLDLVDAFFDR